MNQSSITVEFPPHKFRKSFSYKMVAPHQPWHVQLSAHQHNTGPISTQMHLYVVMHFCFFTVSHKMKFYLCSTERTNLSLKRLLWPPKQQLKLELFVVTASWSLRRSCKKPARLPLIENLSIWSLRVCFQDDSLDS